jgi:RNA polymerase sigma-70 factor (ECF subfamily)
MMMHKDPNDRMREFVRELTEHQAALRAFVGYLLAGVSDAQDVAQEVNLLLWEKRDQFEPGTNFRAWAFATARFVVLGHRRRLRRDGALIFDNELLERLADEWQAEPDEHARKLSALEHCIEKLPDEDLVLVKHRYRSHGEVEQLAGRIGKSAASLRLRLFRLRASLKQCVKRELEAEGGPA